MMTEFLLACIGIFVVLIVLSALIAGRYDDDDNDDQIL
jgi:hypothetical protein